MGVHGLTSYIAENSSLYLKPYELSDCNLVIDGSNIAHVLFRKLKSHSAFGGDYDEYFTLVRSFMLGLKKCNVNPIVLFDGGCDKEKLKTSLLRKRSNVTKLYSFCQGFSAEIVYPLFMKEVFLNVLRDFGFIYVQCNTEADKEIATVARILNCPVMSYDSDYFIYNVIYIPFNTVKLRPVKFSNSDKYYIECSICNPDEFLKSMGVDRPLLPILATLLGNDQVENIVFSKFFNHVRMGRGKNKSKSQKRVHGLIQWLKNENSESAVNLILSHLRKNDVKRVSKIFDDANNFYSPSHLSKSVANELSEKFGEIFFSKNDFNINWPLEIAKLYHQAFIPSFSVNMILHQIYYTSLQIENIYENSSYFKSLNLIRKIYTMLVPYTETEKPLKLYLIIKKQYRSINVDTDPSNYINLDEVIKKPQEERLKLLCELADVAIEHIKFVPQNSWTIFIMGFLYWIKEYYNDVSLSHLHAFVIMIIANQIVQREVGYYRNNRYFMRNYGAKINEFKQIKLFQNRDNKSTNFEEMLSNVTLSECLVVQKELIPLRKTTLEGSGKNYCPSTIHLFNCFQSCLSFIKFINAFLNHPLPHLRIEEFYSGTLLFNLYILIKSKTSVEKFGSSLFSQTPNLDKIYKYLTVKLSEISKLNNKTDLNIVKGKKKRKRNKSCSLKILENIHCSEDSENEFIDENNKYSVLLKINALPMY